MLLNRCLRSIARRTIRKTRPFVIGITGSVGKTSTREAVRCALGNTRRVRAAVQNYNNELGLPLTVLGESAQDSSLIGWAGVLWRGWYRSWRRQKDNPDVLVLEYGADRKGDMVYLTSIARPHVAVGALHVVVRILRGVVRVRVEQHGGLLVRECM